MKKPYINRNLWICIALLLALAASPALAQDESGGTVGADFLTVPPATRVDALGGVLDGLALNLDAIYYNPSVLAAVDNFQLQINVNPLPNEVTHSQLAVGLPLFGGTFGGSVQLLNSGGFTYVSSSGQPQATVNVYDAAALLSYSRYVWRTLALGLNVKGIYRTLGEYNAISIASDLGTSYRFETPHIGQRPKAPTFKQLETVYKKDLQTIEKAKEDRTKKEAAGSASWQKQVADKEADIQGLTEKIAAEEDQEKKQELESKKQDEETLLTDLKKELDKAQANDSTALNQIDVWYREETAAAKTRFDQRVADLQWVDSERRKLFALIDDASKELTAEQINTNIDQSIDRTWSFLADRKKTLNTGNTTYQEKRRKLIASLTEDIGKYNDQIEKEVGPQAAQLSRDIETLTAQKAAAEESENKDQAKEIQTQISANQKKLDALSTDPWVKRLQKRVADKQQEIQYIEAGIGRKDEETAAAIETAAKSAEADIKEFESLRNTLQKNLQKAKLKRELDELDARNEKGLEKAQNDYKNKEKKLYLRLLAAMYGNEEKIFQERLFLAKQDADDRVFDFANDQKKATELLDDEFAFQKRLLSAKINKLKSEKADDSEGSELAKLNEELKQKEDNYQQAIAALDEKAKTFQAEEDRGLERQITAIKDERQKIQLVYLQTDKPYLNTSVGVAMRNGGSNVKFSAEGFPLPLTISASLGYALVNLDNHTVILSSQFDYPVFDQPFVGIGLEYGFAGIAYIRGGYSFGSVERSYSAGFGVHIGLGFTEFTVDYAFRPLPDYGFQHSIGVALLF